MTTFATLLGAVLTILYAWFLAQPDVLSVLTPSAFASFDRILVPLLAFTAVIGVLVLDRMATLGLVLLLAGTVFGLTGGTIWLLPGAVLGCIWAARHHRAARATLGFLLLVPGVAAVFYALLAALGVLSGLPASSLGPFAPRSLGQDLAPLEFLPLALLGAWLLVRPLDRRRKL
ncbi:MAG: hypothetical protein ACRD0Y_06390 [Terriglobales bacterium]